MMQQPLVSIITPAYNRANLLVETIESVLAQDYPNLEYIVLDDGSTDGTLDVLKRYEGRLHWESHPNMGETRTVNKGFELARGEIVGVVNSDDPLLPGAVSKLVAALVEHPEVMVAYPDWLIIDAHGNTIQKFAAYDYTGYCDMVRRHFCLPGPAAFFRRRVIDEVGGRDPRFRYVGDLEFWYRAGCIGDFLRVPEVLATFRVHPGSATVSQRGTRMAEEHVEVMDKLYAFSLLPAAASAIKDEAYSSAYFVAGCNLGRGSLGKKISFFHKALALVPWKYMGEYKRRWIMMLLAFSPISLDRSYNFLIRFRKGN
jgi:glycosyltransferase involved in cell wall biosynthesis